VLKKDKDRVFCGILQAARQSDDGDSDETISLMLVCLGIPSGTIEDQQKMASC
jgi:hypothetical protein